MENITNKGFKEAQNKTLESFLADIFEYPRPNYASFSFTLDAIDPLAFLELRWSENTFQYYWEKPSDDFAIAAGGEIISVSASGENRFGKVNEQIDSILESAAEYTAVPHAYSGMMFIGGFSFFNEMENGLWNSFKPAALTVPKWTIIKDGKFNIVTLSVDLDKFKSAQKLHSYLVNTFADISDTCNIRFSDLDNRSRNNGAQHSIPDPASKDDQSRWIDSVSKAKELIGEKAFNKIVLARRISFDKNPSLLSTEVLNSLRGQYPNCYNFLIHRPDNTTFLGSSPERLASFRGRLLLTEALAGSMQRGKTATEDTIFEKHLSESGKNIEEHNFVIKAIEERLAPFTKSLDRRNKPEIKKLSNVQHLYTPIRAQLQHDADLLEVLGELHPTPAVGGYPWHKAAPHIRTLENFERGWYAAPVGWINSKGVGEFSVAIRSGLLTENRAHFFAGCGIVADSDPMAEWEETNLKLKPMLSAL